jgi:FeS assembly protein IscX
VNPLYWDASFAIACRLRREHPVVDLQQVSLSQIFDWVIALPDFADEPELVNDELLMAIYQDWYEESSAL